VVRGRDRNERSDEDHKALLGTNTDGPNHPVSGA
jgi:hypothetical protein